MIDAKELLTDCRRVADALVDDLRARTDDHEESSESARLVYVQAQMAGRTDKTWEEWREDLLAQVASGWVLAAVFVRFCEDNRLVDDPLLSGPGDRGQIARDHRAEFFAANPQAGNREWLQEVFGRYRKLPAVSEVFGERNPLWQLAPSADGARELLELWWATDDGGKQLRHDFTDPDWGTRFLGDLYQDLSEHARKQYALLQTPDFVEDFILDRTLGPAIAEFGLDDFKMIDPTCGSGHFLLGAFDRLVEAWRGAEPNTPPRELAQRALDSVHGVDINPFAAAIARFRLLVAALKVSGESRLENLPGFTLNLAVGDSLLHGSHGGRLFPPEDIKSALAHHYPTEDADEADQILQPDHYHAVVGNPPYITVKDKALNGAYRALYSACHRQYALTVPFMQRFHDLAVPAKAVQAAGFVGQITSNSFMKREFGKKLIQEFLASRDLTHVIDTSGAYIPGHGTPTVILLSRDRPFGGSTRAALGIRGEPNTPADPALGMVWSAIVAQIDRPGSETDYLSVEDVRDGRFHVHPWSLQGGAAPEVLTLIQDARLVVLEARATGGRMATVGEDAAYEGPDRPYAVRPVTGTLVRDWRAGRADPQNWVYDSTGGRLPFKQLDQELQRQLWRQRRRLQARKLFGVPITETTVAWYEWREFRRDKFRGRSLVFPLVATHNNFALVQDELCRDSAPVLKLAEGASEDEHLALLGLLNSSAACFWMKQVFHCKGSTVDTAGARQTTVPFEDFYEFDATKLKQFPIPAEAPTTVARCLDGLAQRLGEVLPGAIAGASVPTGEVLAPASVQARGLRARMVAFQEELDWECYHLYGLTPESLTMDPDRVPPLEKGERAFEIALGRRMATGEADSTWFVRHRSTPITELPSHWPDEYRALVERRLELIENDRSIRLLERPEYKRRWNWDDLDELGRQAQRTWLIDRIETLIGDREAEPAVTTVARLADRLAQDPDAVQVARDLAGTSVDLVDLADELVAESAVPFLAAWRYTDSGMVKRRAWERTWDLQRVEDRLDARAALPEGNPEHLDESALNLARKEAGLEKIPVPPKYATKDFRDTVTYRMRGKLDVPKERFISYPGTKAGADTTAVIGWAGWDHLQQARALAAHYNTRRSDGAETDELVPLLAGLAELVPWLKQWHNDPDPTFGERMGDFFAGFVDSEAAAIGVTTRDLADWRPPAKTTRRRRKKASS